MKRLITIIAAIFLLGKTEAQKTKYQNYKDIDMSNWERRCAVAHYQNGGVFTCDYKGTYYPEIIFDSTITKWFIKTVKGDSLFYYRHDVINYYIWNGRPKNEEYGYEWKDGSGSVIMPDKYNGSDTITVREQLWSPIK